METLASRINRLAQEGFDIRCLQGNLESNGSQIEGLVTRTSPYSARAARTLGIFEDEEGVQHGAEYLLGKPCDEKRWLRPIIAYLLREGKIKSEHDHCGAEIHAIVDFDHNFTYLAWLPEMQD